MRRFVPFVLVLLVAAMAAIAAAQQPAPTTTRVPVSGPISVLAGPGGNVGDIRNWVRQLDTILAALPAGAKIIPGHGPLAFSSGPPCCLSCTSGKDLRGRVPPFIHSLPV